MKIEDTEMAIPKHDVKLSNSVIKTDRLMFVVYLIVFVMFNAFYFIIYFDWNKQNLLGVRSKNSNLGVRNTSNILEFFGDKNY